MAIGAEVRTRDAEEVKVARQNAEQEVAFQLRSAQQRTLVQQISAVQSSMEKKKMTGLVFWLVLLLAVLKDILDPLLEITFFLTVLVWPVTFVIGIVVACYFFVNRIKPGTKKTALWSLTALVEFIPGLDIIPTFTFTYVATRVIENRAIKKRNASKQKQLKQLQKQLAKIR